MGLSAGGGEHHPLPGQPAGVADAEYVGATIHGAHPDLRFSIDDLIAGDHLLSTFTSQLQLYRATIVPASF
jgi:hypothetical protein